jgi:hypothetical protein
MATTGSVEIRFWTYCEGARKLKFAIYYSYIQEEMLINLRYAHTFAICSCFCGMLWGGDRRNQRFPIVFSVKSSLSIGSLELLSALDDRILLVQSDCEWSLSVTIYINRNWPLSHRVIPIMRTRCFSRPQWYSKPWITCIAGVPYCQAEKILYYHGQGCQLCDFYEDWNDITQLPTTQSRISHRSVNPSVTTNGSAWNPCPGSASWTRLKMANTNPTKFLFTVVD